MNLRSWGTRGNRSSARLEESPFRFALGILIAGLAAATLCLRVGSTYARR
jgi:hypothetical protein